MFSRKLVRRPGNDPPETGELRSGRGRAGRGEAGCAPGVREALPGLRCKRRARANVCVCVSLRVCAACNAAPGNSGRGGKGREGKGKDKGQKGKRKPGYSRVEPLKWLKEEV